MNIRFKASARDVSKENIDTAYMVTKTLLIISAVASFITGIVLLAVSKGDLSMIWSGIITIIASPFVAYLMWIFLKLPFGLLYDVKLLREGRAITPVDEGNPNVSPLVPQSEKGDSSFVTVLPKEEISVTGEQALEVMRNALNQLFQNAPIAEIISGLSVYSNKEIVEFSDLLKKTSENAERQEKAKDYIRAFIAKNGL